MFGNRHATTYRPEGALKMLAKAALASALYPRAWIAVWILITVPALLAVVPEVSRIDEALASHPGASMRVDQALDADLVRQDAGRMVALDGASLFVLLAVTLLAGGILLGVGRDGKRPLATFLTDGARMFARNARVLVVGGVLALLLTWGLDTLDRWMRAEWLYEVDPGAGVKGVPWLSVEFALEAWRYLQGLAFLWLVFAGKLAMAWLAVRDRRSALLAWGRSVVFSLRHPLRVGVVVGAFALAWIAVSHVVGEVTARVLEADAPQPWINLGIGLATGQIGIVWSSIMIVTAFVVARSMTESSVHNAARVIDLEPLPE